MRSDDASRDGEDTGRSHHNVVDVRAALAHAYRVQDPPGRSEGQELRGDGLLAVSTDPPRALLGAGADEPRKHVLEGALGIALLRRALASGGAYTVGAEVVPSGCERGKRCLWRGR